MKFFIKVNLTKMNSMLVAGEVLQILKEQQQEFKFCQEEGIEKIAEDKIVSVEDGVRWCDVIITVGGDGTLLSVGEIAANYNKPIFGINTGDVGFLTAIERTEVSLLKNICDENVFNIKKHHFLQTKINDSEWKYCLNDVVISKSMYTNVVLYKLYSNDRLLMEFSGDGIIVATSTGSTAYSLSVGGPIVDNDLQAMVISPVSPHTLNRASLVLGQNKKIKITASARNNKRAYIAFDGDDYQEVYTDDEVSVRLSEKYVSIYVLDKLGQFEKVNQKLKLR